jgi:hypothetical protein
MLCDNLKFGRLGVDPIVKLLESTQTRSSEAVHVGMDSMEPPSCVVTITSLKVTQAGAPTKPT